MTEQLKQLALECKERELDIDFDDVYPQQGSSYLNKLARHYIAAASPDVVLALIAERDELKLAYAECSRQKNELLTAHKVNARREADDEALMREALDALEYHNAYTRPIVKTNDAIDKLRARLGTTNATEAKHL